MLAASGADAVESGVASVEDVDSAMRLGVNYPLGPIEWGDAVGWRWVEGVLTAIGAAEDPHRYRVTDAVRRRAAATSHG